MKDSSDISGPVNRIVLILAIIVAACNLCKAQDYKFGVSADPIIGWFRSDVDSIRNAGTRAGFDLTVRGERPLTGNISMTGGISFINSGGRLKNSHPVYFRLQNFITYVKANNPVIYRIQYISVPVGFKFSTNETGDYTFFGELGLDPKIVIRGRVDIPSNNLSNERAMKEINRFNMGWYINGGVNYLINDTFSVVLGIGFENNFADVTRDVGSQGTDKISQRFIRFIFGANFQLFQ